MKLLFYTEIAPFPPYGGEKIRTVGLLKLFEHLELNTMAITGKTENQEWKSNFRHITFREFYFNRTEQGRWEEALSIFKKDKNFTEQLLQVAKEFDPDVVYIDYHFYGQYIDVFKKLSLPVIYGTHNAQAQLMMQRPSLSLRNKISNFIEYRIYRYHERKYFKKADALIAVSEQDITYYKHFLSASRLHLIPNFIDEDEYIHYQVNHNEKENYIIMSGNFYAYQNAAGLQWFLENVWDKELSAMTKLIITGNYSEKILESINRNKKYYNVVALGTVENIKPVIAKAKAAIVPLLHGSGTRLKCIEAMALKTQIVSTSKGAEGIEHKGSVILSDDALSFKSNILKVLKGELDYTKEAFEVFMAKYSLTPNAQIFNNILTQLKKNNA